MGRGRGGGLVVFVFGRRRRLLPSPDQGGDWAFGVPKAGRILVFAPDVSSLRAGSSVRALEFLDRRVPDPVQVQYRWRATAVMELPSIPGRSLTDSPHRRRPPGVQRRLIGSNVFMVARIYKCGSIMAEVPREIAGWQRGAALTKHDLHSAGRENGACSH